MKKILLLLTITLLFGCDNEPLPIDNNGNTMDRGGITGYRLEIIDGCEYIKYGRSLTHKGNCKNKIHIYNLKK